MGDATDARIAKSLESIDRSIRNIAKSMETLNENFVAIGRLFNQWLDNIESDEEIEASARLSLVKKDDEDGA